MENYYELLEVDKNASTKVIKGVYKLHIKENHPDLFQGEEKKKAEEKLKKLNEAYHVLCDEAKRKEYDIQLFQEYEDKLAKLKEENDRLKGVLEEVCAGDKTTNTDMVEEDETYTNNKKYLFNLQKKEWIIKIAVTLCALLAAGVGIYKATGYNLFSILWNALKESFR